MVWNYTNNRHNQEISMLTMSSNNYKPRKVLKAMSFSIVIVNNNVT